MPVTRALAKSRKTAFSELYPQAPDSLTKKPKKKSAPKEPGQARVTKPRGKGRGKAKGKGKKKAAPKMKSKNEKPAKGKESEDATVTSEAAPANDPSQAPRPRGPPPAPAPPPPPPRPYPPPAPPRPTPPPPPFYAALAEEQGVSAMSEATPAPSVNASMSTPYSPTSIHHGPTSTQYAPTARQPNPLMTTCEDTPPTPASEQALTHRGYSPASSMSQPERSPVPRYSPVVDPSTPEFYKSKPGFAEGYREGYSSVNEETKDEASSTSQPEYSPVPKYSPVVEPSTPEFYKSKPGFAEGYREGYSSVNEEPKKDTATRIKEGSARLIGAIDSKGTFGQPPHSPSPATPSFGGFKEKFTASKSHLSDHGPFSAPSTKTQFSDELSSPMTTASGSEARYSPPYKPSSPQYKPSSPPYKPSSPTFEPEAPIYNSASATSYQSSAPMMGSASETKAGVAASAPTVESSEEDTDIDGLFGDGNGGGEDAAAQVEATPTPPSVPKVIDELSRSPSIGM